MGSFVSGLLLAGALVLTLVLLNSQARRRRKQPGPAGVLEYRTDHPLDVCMDYLAHQNIHDGFEYTCIRQPDGSFLLHFTLHRATRQPVDTLYSLRLDPGRQTVVTLHFIREAFGSREPVFPQALLDEFLLQKLDARPMIRG